MTKYEFYWQCFRLGLSLQETETADKICVAMLIKYGEFIRQLQEKPTMLTNLKILANEKDDAERYPQNRSFLPPKE